MSVEDVVQPVDIAALRAELKRWEADFRARNGGRDAERAEMKRDATIAAKYKLYNQATRRNDSKTILPPSHPVGTPKKSTRPRPVGDALRERQQNATFSSTPKETPQKTKHTAPSQQVSSPVQEVYPTPAFIRNALGPTPQKDGQVLGIFDILSTGTPAKGKGEKARNTDLGVAATPSKMTHISPDNAFSRTPPSAGKRFYLDAFAGTPLKRKREGEGEDNGTSSSSKRKFATPAFLRRSFPLASIHEEEGGETRPAPAPFRKQGLVRSLSSIIHGLRKQEREAMDEEWDILNEIEGEHQQQKHQKKPSILVEDDQTVEMPLGPDQAAESSEEAPAEEERHGPARKPWKKKGLKRQTRRVIMRPVLHKAKKAEEGDVSDADEDELGQNAQLRHTNNDDDDDNEKDPTGTSDVDNHNDAGSKTKTSTAKKSAAHGVKPSKDKERKDDDVKATKKARKIDPHAHAHANFRKLKIKNKNSKANGRGGRFGRR